MSDASGITKATAGEAAAVALSQLRAVPAFNQQEPEAIEAPGVPPGARSRWNASGTPWGAPMHELVSAEKRSPATPDSSPGWGRTVNVAPGQLVGCARVMLDKGEPLTLTADVTSPAPWGTDVDGGVIQPLAVWLQTTYGNGSTSAQKNLRVDAHMDTPILASYLDVICFVGDLSGNPIPASMIAQIKNNPVAQVAIQVSRGVRGLPIHGTLFQSGKGVSSAVANAPGILAPCRIESVQAHLLAAVAGDHFVQLFDSLTLPNNTTVPVEEWPIGSTPAPGLPLVRLTSPRGFSRGCFYALSTTGGSLTLATDGSNLWISLESQLL